MMHINKGKVLIIDDERPTLNMFELFLKAYGYDVLTAENGQAGLELFQKERPGIVFTDVKMPGMGGLEVVKRLKGIDPGVQVIVMTGHGDAGLAVEASLNKAVAFINKPIKRTVLEEALKQAEKSMAEAS